MPKRLDLVLLLRQHHLNDGLMLGQRHRRWPNIDPVLGQRLVCTLQDEDLQQPHPWSYLVSSSLLGRTT